MAEFRRDIGQLRPPRRLPNGSLVVDATLSRTGVFDYRRADGSIRREYRPPGEVFHKDALQSFQFAIVTDDHPPVAVNPANAREYSRGSTGESIRQDGDFIVASLVITDAELIAKVEGGKREVSSGYLVEVENTSGVSPQGERYDAIQRRIRGNHVAIVDEGRAGPEVRLRMDEAAMVPPVAGSDLACYSEGVMSVDVNDFLSERLDKSEKQVSDERARADKAEARADAAESRASDAESKLAAETKRADEAEAARDTATARADAAENPAEMREIVRARMTLEESAAKFLGDEYKFDTSDGKPKTDREIQMDVLNKLDVKVEGKSEAYIAARFDTETERYQHTDAELGETVTAAYANDSRNDGRGQLRPLHEVKAERDRHETERWKTIGKSGAAAKRGSN